MEKGQSVPTSKETGCDESKNKQGHFRLQVL